LGDDDDGDGNGDGNGGGAAMMVTGSGKGDINNYEDSGKGDRMSGSRVTSTTMTIAAKAA
jgi:hypothetical protein